MSVELETARVAYSGSGSTGPFSIPFYFLANSHIRAVKLSTAGVESTLTLTTDYTLTGAGDEDGGTLTLVVALATGETLTITRNVPLTQETNWPIADPFPAASHEQAADKLTMIVQQIDDTLGRTLRQPVSDATALAELPIAASRASMALTFDADGQPLMADISETVLSFSPTTQAFDGDGTTVAFTLSGAPSSASALIVRIDGVVQTPITDYTVSGTTLTFTTAPATGTGNIVVQNFGIARELNTVAVDNVSGLGNSDGSSKVGFAQSGTGAIAEDLQSRNRRVLYVTDFKNDSEARVGASSGTDDDITGLRKAWTEQQALVKTVVSANLSLTHGTAPKLNFLSGVYRISGDINNNVNSHNWKAFVGDDAIIKMDAGVTAFTKVRYMVQFKGLQFFDGATALAIATENVGSSVIDVDNCVFFGQSDKAIKQDATSNSTLVTVRNSKFILPTTGAPYVYYGESGDHVSFESCWITIGGGTTIAFRNGGAMYLRNILGVPNTGMVSWIDNYHVLDVDTFRFGGEANTQSIVRNYADMDITGEIDLPTKVRIRNCPTYTTDYMVEFHKLPNIVEIENCDGLLNNAGFFFAAALTYVDFYRFQRWGQCSIRSNYGSGFPDKPFAYNISTAGDLGAKVFLASMMRNGSIKPRLRSRLRVNEIFGSGHVGTVTNWTADGTLSAAHVNDDYGVGRRQYTSSADSQQMNRANGTYLNQAVLTLGEMYTLCFQVEAETNPAHIIVEIGGARQDFDIPIGKSNICMPFVYLNGTGAASTTYDTFAYTIYMRRNGDVCYTGRHMLFKGAIQYDGETLELEDDASPAAFTNGISSNTGYFRGDRSYRTNAAVGGPSSDICTVQGAPGTWAEEQGAVLQGSATYDPPSLVDAAGATTTVTVTGAALGDFAEASFSLDLQGITVTAWVSAANTVSVRFQNETAGTLDLASGTLRARVRKA